VFPALLPVERHSPAHYPFGRWSLPAAGVLCTSSLSYASVTMSPIARGHVLIMPRSNTARLADLPADELADMAMLAQYIARVFEKHLQGAGFSFGQCTTDKRRRVK
jgi:diadenosine tetraphosphate (Ap4A) HIT family hydrolase